MSSETAGSCGGILKPPVQNGRAEFSIPGSQYAPRTVYNRLACICDLPPPQFTIEWPPAEG